LKKLVRGYKNEKRIDEIIKKLQPYVNGKLITHVFVRYWEELKELIKEC